MPKPAASHTSLRGSSLIEQVLLGVWALGLIVMLSFPDARAMSDLVGWTPFWLMMLPLSSWLMARMLRHRHADELATAPMAQVHRLGARRAPQTSPVRRAA